MAVSGTHIKSSGGRTSEVQQHRTFVPALFPRLGGVSLSRNRFNIRTLASRLTRTADPQLRRLLLYPTELWTRVGMSGFEPPHSCSQSGPGKVSRDILSALPFLFFVAAEEVTFPSCSLQLSKGISRNHVVSSPKCDVSVLHHQTSVRRSYLIAVQPAAGGHLSHAWSWRGSRRGSAAVYFFE